MSFLHNMASLFRLWRLKKRKQVVVIRGSCNMCGKCCREISLYVDSTWLRSEKQVRKASIKNPHLNFFKIIGKTEDGFLKFACTHLGEDGLCTDYENRPTLCRTFPSPSIFLQHGQLPEGCGFRMSTEIDFEKVLEDTCNGKACIKSSKRKYF
ncbi:YkgJ family cysteine cluster protein [Desulfovibrio gilichinskyi]|uniref:Zinc-or iron-chelating domain-containing protein n=1 Tax=Desulfovibrio gilichinskyi TaxID=1519643 RepID=A0A1X7CXF7_9BACT|nr:YkgJ family cysteine cluster protein [Desulfovibrio gilichinskyi]SMF04893.1 hypothetical protein SAMN06295933_1388 [Desulfovibrio gilichinskyi]